MAITTGRAHCGAVDRHSRARRGIRYFIVSILCAACIVQFATNPARAQCTARDVLQNQLKLKTRPAEESQQLIQSGRDVATWKPITICTFADPIGLRNKLDGMGCSIGGQAAEILARPTFILGSRISDVQLVLVSPAQLGFRSDTVTFS
jgi:hypothetical protein